jgi:phosphatidylserine/phosphatidylglycerophosphate/cardiolipin synthase-like enzyme
MKLYLAVSAFLIAAALLVGPATAANVEIHYSPDERLDAIDAKLIGEAKNSIDLAAYTITNWTVIDALKAAEARGVAVRIVVDPREPVDTGRLGDLAAEIRIKRGGALMHLKGISIDGEILRTGSANFSYSGERQQDNDLVILRDRDVARKFETRFEKIWDAAQ